jgi:aminoglycoside phosphotransferase (APT) family kinase protein
LPSGGAVPEARWPALHPDVEAVLDALGSHPVDIVPITTLPSPVLERGTYRVRLSSGATVKVSLQAQEDRAAVVATMLRLARHPHLTELLGHQRRAIVTEWVEGEWPSTVTPQLLETCGGVLGSLHTIQVPASFRPNRNLTGWRWTLRDQLRKIVEAGLLEPAAAADLIALAEGAAPPGMNVGFTHRDFCPANLVIDCAGLVRAIDSDSMAFDPCDYDLGRWWYRWPMDRADRESFLRGYARHRDPSGFQRHFVFWMVLVLVESALFRISGRTGGEETPVEGLKALLLNPEPLHP